MAVYEVLGGLVLGGLMGMVGQGARAVIGLKKRRDENLLKDPSEADQFMASRLAISLMIGFITGVAAAIILGIEKLLDVKADNLQSLMGIAAAGYAGTDAIESFVARLPGTSPPSAPAVRAAPPAPAQRSGPPRAAFVAASKTAALDGGTAIDTATPEAVKKMFVPETPMKNIQTHLPHVVAGLRGEGFADRDMLLMALATIRAESEGFAPIREGLSKFNTKNAPFDLYEPGTGPGKRLGNTRAGDGALFKGRGFIQLTGRDNYRRIGAQLGVDLLGDPDQANDPGLAGRILARFLANKEDKIRAALAKGDLGAARKLVNGGAHGIDRFKDAFAKGELLFPDEDAVA